ncbi:hypothetical protein BO94DRAFT_482777 [Aspergillus sclerotioniger CBS 115572]|uniref:Uncharacterized protein n=1 Tax=Aspergillus sclerotioniger CBS 115572 TaxID=1450535 RepID=A0A317XBG9_9EURO|nr:hypothetical protein BO94DRAFT_482777 [Aspergillus sclerotioniger CBS 115572]PWY95859.1 hypothetical protein BO94DRAFT_482777 [Aspergillus sclerotioniger CBS 115572]
MRDFSSNKDIMSSSQSLSDLSLSPPQHPSHNPPSTSNTNLLEISSSDFDTLSSDSTPSPPSPSRRRLVRSGIVKKVSSGFKKRSGQSFRQRLASLISSPRGSRMSSPGVGSRSPGSSLASSVSAPDSDYILQEDIKQEEEDEEFVSGADEVDPRELNIDDARKSKKRKRNLDVNYMPGSEEDEDDASNEKVVPDANEVDPTELIDIAAKKPAKRKRDVDAAYVPGEDKDGDDSQSDIATAPSGRTYKRRNVLKNTAAQKAPLRTPEKAKKPILPITPSRETDPVKVEEPDSQSEDAKITSHASYPTPESLLTKTTNNVRDLSSPTRRYRAPVKPQTGDNAEYIPEKAISPILQGSREGTSDSKHAASSHLEDDEEEYQDRPIRHNETTGIVFDFSVERAKRWASAINVPEGLYNSEEKDLFFRLAMRGFEPVLPKIWRHDFPTLPESLYPRGAEPNSTPIIDVTRSSNSYATKALSNLFAVGGRVRDCEILRQRAEPLIKQAIKNYIRWALFDANLHTAKGAVPVHVIYDQKKGESTLKAVHNMNRKLRNLVRRHHEALGVTTDAHLKSESSEHEQQPTPAKFPLLIGFTICGPIVAILTHSTDPQEIGDGEVQGRFMGQFDLSERGQDVWNSLAIAITVVSVCRTMLSLAQEGKRGYDHERSPSASDIDL